MSDEKVIVGITMGDMNGVGPEVIMKSLLDPAMLELCTPVVFGSQKIFAAHRKTIEAGEFNFHITKDLTQLNPKRANLYSFLEDDVNVEFGKPSPLAGRYALRCIDEACIELLQGTIDVMVTAPVDKNSIAAETPGFTGHTSYIAEKTGSGKPLMLLLNEDLRVGLVTEHVPVKDIVQHITKENIVAKAKLMAKSLLEDFGIRKPVIAVLGLNPHAGDGGTLGKEETEIILPAIEQLRSENIMAFGPFAADGFFGSQSFKKYDGVLAMFHDQGLAPFKALSFRGGVNFTAGLKYVRTSPDHGTAYDLAGKNQADESSFREAIFTAIDIFRKRNNWSEITSNILQIQPRQKEGRER
ncbi:MAG TPA: 4-hydroxythreonine-4-phosphate dehydrogenase PdxA [Bacteroidia bacterium]|jgi:4-hydroxythreonine-4-phosphate dehydrogenase|nr:4-hydroxythreonine-4-phosphate dehydrogenase PdxA [Bacteroidia bacterium]